MLAKLLANWQVTAVVGAVMFALGGASGWTANGWRWGEKYEAQRADYATKERDDYKAAIKERDQAKAEVNTLREAAREDSERIDALSVNRVRCKSVAPAKGSGGVPGSANPSPEAADSASDEDATEIFQQFLKTAGEVNRALGVE